MTNAKTAVQIIRRLKQLADPRVRRAMARFAVPIDKALGIPTPALRKLAREIGKDHELAENLWKSGIHEARTLAAFIDDSDLVTEEQAERWLRDFDSWDVCDCCCGNLFDKTGFAYRKAVEWSRRKQEFVKRAGFSLMAALAVHDKGARDAKFLMFLPIIRRESVDERNFVKKAVNWALRQIGKRNSRVNQAAVKAALEIRKMDSRSARWIAADALRELTSEAVQKRLRAAKSSRL